MVCGVSIFSGCRERERESENVVRKGRVTWRGGFLLFFFSFPTFFCLVRLNKLIVYSTCFIFQSIFKVV